jgi:hypothetical protein
MQSKSSARHTTHTAKRKREGITDLSKAARKNEGLAGLRKERDVGLAEMATGGEVSRVVWPPLPPEAIRLE